MTDIDETAALVTLLRTSRGLAWHELARLVEEAGTAVGVLDRLPGEPQTLFDANEGTENDTARQLEVAKRDVAEWEAEGLHVVTVLDSDYPANLRSVYNRPPLLFIAGAVETVDVKSVAVVGARKASDEGRARAHRIARELSESGYTIVSGLAEGIDTAAHRGAMEANGRTVAVIGTGLRRAYPAKNAELQRHLIDEHAVISQFWPDQPPTRQSFPMRNATMSGLSLATIVVEASKTSGARMQARLALEHGRPVFLLESLVREHEWAQAMSDRPGVYVVGSSGEVAGRIASVNVLDPLVLS